MTEEAENEDDGWYDADEEPRFSQNFQDLLYGDDGYDDEDEDFSDIEEQPQKEDQNGESEAEFADGDIDVDFELIKPEQASAAAVKLAEKCISIDAGGTNSMESVAIFAPAESASKLHFAFVCCGLELGLRLTDRLLDDVDPSVVTSTLCAPIWKALLKVKRRKKSRRESLFSTLLQTDDLGENENIVERSMLLAPVVGAREWVARVTNRLIRAEMANQMDLTSSLTFVSSFFGQCKAITTKVGLIFSASY